MDERTMDETRAEVRQAYGKVAKTAGASCCAPGCCGGSKPEASRALGYSEADLAAVPEGANMGLGCGNPQAIAPELTTTTRSPCSRRRAICATTLSSTPSRSTPSSSAMTDEPSLMTTVRLKDRRVSGPAPVVV